jgi:hypothetical protein
MPAVRNVPDFDSFEYRQACFRLGLEPTPIQQFTFKNGEEALGHSIVVGVADRAHGGHDTHLPAAFTERIGGVLAAAVGMMDYLLRPPQPQGHVQRTQDQLGPKMGFHRPAHDPARPDIQHYKSKGYSRTFQAVGWDHCLPGGNNQPARRH